MHLAKVYGQHPFAFLRLVDDPRLTEQELSVLMAWEELSWEHPTQTEFYAALAAGRLTEGWDGRLASLRGRERQPRLIRNLDEVPEGWTPPTKEEVQEAMRGKSVFAGLVKE